MHPATDSALEPAIAHRGNTKKGKMRMFYVVFSLFAVLAVIAGFFSRYFAPMMDGNFKPKPFVHLHAAMFFTWIAIAVLQPVLIRMGYRNLHRKLGIPAAFLAAGMVVVGCLLAITSANTVFASSGFQSLF